MLSPADEELIRRDSTLPGLRYALDGDALCELVVAQAQLAESAATGGIVGFIERAGFAHPVEEPP